MSLTFEKSDMPFSQSDNNETIIKTALAQSELFSDIERNAAYLDSSGDPPVTEIALLARCHILSDAADWARAIVANGNAAPELTTVRDFLSRLGEANLSLARLFEGHFNALYLISRYGSARQIASAARDAKAGLLFAVWNADQGGGVVLDPVTASTFKLRGAKRFASGTGLVRRPLITASHEDQRYMVVVPLNEDSAKFASWTASGMRASISGDASFDGVEIETETIVGEHGDYYRQPAFSAGAWRFLAAQYGAVKALVDHLQSHLVATNRATDLLQQARLGEALVAVETARLWVYHASMNAEDQNMPFESRVAYVNLARHAVERAALDVIEIVQRSVGLSAFLKPHPIERISRDLSVYLRQPAPDQALLTAARYALESKVADR